MYVGVVAVLSVERIRNPDPISTETRHTVSGLRISARDGRIIEKEDNMIFWTTGHDAPRPGDGLAIVSAFCNEEKGDVLVVTQYNTINLNFWAILGRRGVNATVDEKAVSPTPKRLRSISINSDCLTEKPIPEVQVSTSTLKKNDLIPLSLSTSTPSSNAYVACSADNNSTNGVNKQKPHKVQPQRRSSASPHSDVGATVPRLGGSKRPPPNSIITAAEEDDNRHHAPQSQGPCCFPTTSTTTTSSTTSTNSSSSLDVTHGDRDEYAVALDAALDQLLGPDCTSTPRKQQQSATPTPFLQVVYPSPTPYSNNQVEYVQSQEGVGVKLDLGNLDKCRTGNSLTVSLLNICTVNGNQFFGVDIDNREAMVTMQQDCKFIEGCVYRVTASPCRMEPDKMEPETDLSINAVSAAPHPGADVRALFKYGRPIGCRWLSYTPASGKELESIHDVRSEVSKRKLHSRERKDFVGIVTGYDHGNSYFVLFEDGTHRRVFFGMPPLQALQFRTNAAVQKLPIGKVIACKNAAVGYSRGSMANHAGYVALVDSNSIIIPIAPAEQVAKTLIATYHRVRHRLVFS
ncbi:hypothetical protein Pelo_1630 [Pelomyxa schiedti]|nr:hypothetical protein Pelo_1630 [Pelomyxa schiedti]